MRKTILLVLSGIMALAAFNSCSKKDKKDDPAAPNAYATGGTNLLSFNLSAPGSATNKVISGLQPGEILMGIDIRPANNQLYGVGSTSRLYQINTATGAATAVSAAPFSELLSGSVFGVDFNPSVDRLRIVSNSGQNLRIHPETGALVAKDTDLNPTGTAICAAAYSNNTAGAATTVLYDIGVIADKLYRQDPPNGGILISVGPLGVDADGSNGFDISGDSNKAYALLTTGGSTKLYTINLQTGAATAVGDFPAAVKGLAVALNL